MCNKMSVYKHNCSNTCSETALQPKVQLTAMEKKNKSVTWTKVVKILLKVLNLCLCNRQQYCGNFNSSTT